MLDDDLQTLAKLNYFTLTCSNVDLLQVGLCPHSCMHEKIKIKQPDTHWITPLFNKKCKI